MGEARITPPVIRLFKLARIFWTLAILLMAGGHVVHAMDEHVGDLAPCGEHHNEGSGHDSCPSGESCSHPHVHSGIALSDGPVFYFLATTSSAYPCLDAKFPDSPFREIDYPPQRA